jgi:hypothetical protein
MPLLCANLFKHQAEPDVVAETGPTELVETLSRYANSGLAESGDVKNNFFEDYSGLAETVRSRTTIGPDLTLEDSELPLPSQRQARRAGAMFRSRLAPVQPPGIAVH